jgi:hypothetical protein
MATRYRTVYELMNWAAEQHDLDPSQRKILYERLENEGILKSSKDPGKQASKYARELKKEADQLRKSVRKSNAVSDKASVKPSRKKSKEDIEEMQDEFGFDGIEGSEGNNWYEEDVDREDYPDYYDSEC